MTRVFISYRRDDSADTSARLYDQLESRFRRQNVFKDIDNIPVGVDFRTYLDHALQLTDVVLVVIGPRWLVNGINQGEQRLFAANDFVRIEVEAALRMRKVVIPVLVDGATMPAEDALPPSIGALAYINASRLRSDPDFSHDCDALMASIALYGAQDEMPLPTGMLGPTPENVKRLKDALATVRGKPFQPSLNLYRRRFYRMLLVLLGLLSFGIWATSVVIQYGLNAGRANEVTLFMLPSISIGVDAFGTLLAMGLAIHARRFLWILWLLPLNLIPVGLAPTIYGAIGPIEPPASKRRA
jgi:hypothetical protein